MDVHTKVFAQLPPETDGAPAKILCIVPQGDDLYVCTMKNIYNVTPDGTPSVFLDVANSFQTATGRSLNFDDKGQGGVRSIAFHPKFSRNRLFYISAMEDRPGNPGDFNYISDVSNPISADSVIVEFKIRRSTGLPLINSYRLLFRIGKLKSDHPIRQIAFKGKLLYIAHGDGAFPYGLTGGGQGDNALGNVLRISPRQTSSEDPYRIPTTNPFVNDPNMKSEVWALGFRNRIISALALPGNFLSRMPDVTMLRKSTL